MVRDRHHCKTNIYWDELPDKIYHGAGKLLRLKTGLQPEQLQKALAAIGLKPQDLEQEETVLPDTILPVPLPVLEETATTLVPQQEIGAEERMPRDWENELKISLRVARGYTTVGRIVEVVKAELTNHLDNDTIPSPGSEAEESSEPSDYMPNSDDMAGDIRLSANSSLEDMGEVTVEQTYREYKKKLDEAEPENRDSMIYVMGVMKSLRKKPENPREATELEEKQSSDSDSEKDSELVPEKTKQQFKPVSGKTPLRMCPNYRDCKYCLCHNCYGTMMQEEVDDSKLPATPSNPRKTSRREATPPGGRRKKTRGKDEISECDHEHLSMLVLEENSAYFRKSYVAKKGEDYDYPAKCSGCSESLVLDM